MRGSGADLKDPHERIIWKVNDACNVFDSAGGVTSYQKANIATWVVNGSRKEISSGADVIVVYHR